MMKKIFSSILFKMVLGLAVVGMAFQLYTLHQKKELEEKYKKDELVLASVKEAKEQQKGKPKEESLEISLDSLGLLRGDNLKESASNIQISKEKMDVLSASFGDDKKEEVMKAFSVKGETIEPESYFSAKKVDQEINKALEERKMNTSFSKEDVSILKDFLQSNKETMTNMFQQKEK